MRHVLITALGVAHLVGCGASNPGGSACKVSGDGFTRMDDCEQTCVDWEITCENGSTVTPSVCSAGSCTDGQACPDGFECLAVGVVERECLPESLCAAPQR